MIQLISILFTISIFIVSSVSASEIQPPDFVHIPVYHDNDTKTIYDDVMRHSKEKPFGNQYGRSTNAHETVHGINSYLRNKYWHKDNKINAFYAGDGKGVVVKDPKIKMQHIVPYIPSILRSYRYKLYFIEQIKDWNDIPTYPIDEWVSYIFGGIVAIDDHKQNIFLEKSDAVSGCLDFSIYCVALSMAVKQHDPDYWNNHPQFKSCILYFLQKAEKTFFSGKDIFKFNEQELLLERLRNHPEAADIRDFLIKEFDGLFIKN